MKKADSNLDAYSFRKLYYGDFEHEPPYNKKSNMEKLIIPLPDGSNILVPMCQFVLNPQQQIACFGIDADKYGGMENIIQPHPEVEYMSMGKLQDLDFIMQAQTTNSLRNEKWNFETYPNPEIVIISKM